MKYKLSLIFLLVSITALAQLQKTDLASKNLFGQVKSTTEVYYRAEDKFGELVKDFKEFTQTEEYNKAGLLTESKIVDGSSVLKITYKYDKMNNLIERKEDHDGEVTLTTVVFDTDGKAVEVNNFDAKGKLETKRKNKFNKDGKHESSSLYFGDGSLKEKDVFVYEAGELAAIETYDPKNLMIRTTMSEWNEKGMLLLEIQMFNNDDGELLIRTTELTYNDKGQIDKKKTSEPSGKVYSEKMEYDDFGNITHNFTDSKNYEKNVYTYDSRNNWTKQIRTWSSSGFVKKYIVERSIKYN